MEFMVIPLLKYIVGRLAQNVDLAASPAEVLRLSISSSLG